MSGSLDEATQFHLAQRRVVGDTVRVHPPFPKAAGPWWVGFRGGKALSDLALSQLTPSKPLAFPPPPPLFCRHA
jgi:hypothetical protein